MLSLFTEGFAKKLGERWANVVFGPSALFWFAVTLSWILAPGGNQRLANARSWLVTQGAVAQVIVLLAGLVVIAVSGTAVQGFSTQVVRALEGYWPRWLGCLRVWLVERGWRRYLHLDFERQQLEATREQWSTPRPGVLLGVGDAPQPATDESARWSAAARDAARAAYLDQRLAWLPSSYQRFKPTRLGNILSAAEERPHNKCGLDAVTCWPHLWLLLGDGERSEIAAARRSLDAGAAFVVWGLLTAGLCLFWLATPWVAGLLAASGISTAVGAHRWLQHAARDYGTLVDAVFDLHRIALYASLGKPVPGPPQSEKAHGEAVTHFLRSGIWTPPGDPKPS
jgi:hypothetical protein